MEIPEVDYARSGGVSVAFQVVGDGPRTLVYMPPVTNLYSLWEQPRAASFLLRLGEAARLVVLNARGGGLSDRPPNLTLESRTEDVNAVLDALECERASIFGADVSANVCALFAATYPERCDRLALFMPFAKLIRTESYPHGPSREEADESIRTARNTWGERSQLESFASSLFDRELIEEPGFLDWFVKERRLATSPASAAEFARMAFDTDITDVLGSIRVATLVLHREHPARLSTSRIVFRMRWSSDSVARGVGFTPTRWPM